MKGIESNLASGMAGREGCAWGRAWGEMRKVSGQGPNSGMRQAKLTNNVAFQGWAKSCETRAQSAAAQSVCNQHKEGQLWGCAGKVTSGGKLGTRLAIYWAVPRQGYGRN